MILHIRNMVCNRCKMVVESELKCLGLRPVKTELGMVTLGEPMPPEMRPAVEASLQAAGFGLVDDRRQQIVEAIKALIVQRVHHRDGLPEGREKWSEVISRHLHQDYSALSRLFSETEAITIEQYLILQKVERAKELLTYDELSLSEIAWRMGYSSVAHLSAQFKKVTGMTPTYFKSIRERGRKSLDEL